MNAAADQVDAQHQLGFGRIRSNLDAADLRRAYAALRSLHLCCVTMQISSGPKTQYEHFPDGRISKAVTALGPDDVIEHRTIIPTDPRSNSETQIVVDSTSPLGRIKLILRPALSRAEPYVPRDNGQGLVSSVGLGMAAVSTAIEHHEHPEIMPPAMNPSIALGAALEVHGDDPRPTDERFVFATGSSRLTPGMMRTGGRFSTVDVPDWERMTALIPASTRITGGYDDGSSEGSVPFTYLDISETRTWARYDDLTALEAMRAHVAWETAKSRTG